MTRQSHAPSAAGSTRPDITPRSLQRVDAWDVFTGLSMLAPGARDELSRLQAALPGYDLLVTSHSHAYRFEAIRLPGGPQAGPWCVVSSDLADLRRELAPWTRPAADTRAAPALGP